MTIKLDPTKPAKLRLTSGEFWSFQDMRERCSLPDGDFDEKNWVKFLCRLIGTGPTMVLRKHRDVRIFIAKDAERIPKKHRIEQMEDDDASGDETEEATEEGRAPGSDEGGGGEEALSQT